MTEDEQILLRAKILATAKEMAAISYRRRILEAEFTQLDQIYMGLWKFKNSLERKLIKPKILSPHKPKLEANPSPLDEAQAALEKMSAAQIRALLAELQGSEEEGQEIEYEDEVEVHVKEDENG
jgi:hypothetical protein